MKRYCECNYPDCTICKICDKYEAENAKLREELTEKDEMITALRMGWTECSESNKDVERALEGFSYSGSYGDGVRKMREELADAKCHEAETVDVAERMYQRAEAAESELAKLRGKLDDALNERDDARGKCSYWMDRQRDEEQTSAEWKQRAELAEAKIRESEGQDPYGWYDTECGQMFFDRHERNPNVEIVLYRFPIPPADVAELQAKFDAAIDALAERDDKEARQAQRIAELERENRRINGLLILSEPNNALVEQQAKSIAELERKLAEQKTYYESVFEDGAKQIAKARAEAVPKCDCGTCRTEGELVQRLYNEAPNYKDTVAAGAQIQHLRALIAAAPKPGEEK